MKEERAAEKMEMIMSYPRKCCFTAKINYNILVRFYFLKVFHFPP